MALRLACHDEKVHATMAPQGSDARAIFDAVEQARVESIGTLRMEGVAANLRSMTEEKYSKANFTGIERQEDAPIGEAVAMMVREKLTGQKPPPPRERFSISGGPSSRRRRVPNSMTLQASSTTSRLSRR